MDLTGQSKPSEQCLPQRLMTTFLLFQFSEPKVTPAYGPCIWTVLLIQSHSLGLSLSLFPCVPPECCSSLDSWPCLQVGSQRFDRTQTETTAPAPHAEHILTNFNYKVQPTSDVEENVVTSAFCPITPPGHRAQSPLGTLEKGRDSRAQARLVTTPPGGGPRCPSTRRLRIPSAGPFLPSQLEMPSPLPSKEVGFLWVVFSQEPPAL